MNFIHSTWIYLKLSIAIWQPIVFHCWTFRFSFLSDLTTILPRPFCAIFYFGLFWGNRFLEVCMYLSVPLTITSLIYTEISCILKSRVVNSTYFFNKCLVLDIELRHYGRLFALFSSFWRDIVIPSAFCAQNLLDFWHQASYAPPSQHVQFCQRSAEGLLCATLSLLQMVGEWVAEKLWSLLWLPLKISGAWIVCLCLLIIQLYHFCQSLD